MRYSAIIQLSTIFFLVIQTGCFQSKPKEKDTELYSGSVSCIECHEKFYELWSGSHHGKAMQPVNHHFVNELEFPVSYPFSIENKDYRMEVKDSVLIMTEIDGDTMHSYEIAWALGGKNVFYFLTPMENGKLQTIPLAFDIRKKEWYNNPESAVRHFPEGTHDEALPWRDRMYTFNTSCYSCHVSQLTSNFDLATDTYQTQWKEPGINCETCHGPGAEHVRVCMEAGEGVIPDDLKIITTSTFTQEQHNASCAPCHARMQPITSGYNPGEPYFDHYDLTTLEHADFYPDGRDLGENYTYTLWLMNTCAQKGELHCVSCHTSSGRNRFAERPNDACITCHAERVNDVTAHTMHLPDSEGSICINCHMPKTEFGRMIRSDHSFRPPMPEATILFGSPNACNICHSDKSASWANNVVKKRENKNYQENTIYRGQLIKEAIAGNWSRLDGMLKIINNPKSDEVLVTSFIRLLAGCEDETKWQSLVRAMNNPSPLVRSAAAASLAGNQTGEAQKSLINATADSIRLVRVSAASALTLLDTNQLSESDRKKVKHANQEYLNSLVTRPDDWSSHYNKGIYYQNRGDAGKALASYETAARLYPESIMPLINSSVLYSYMGNTSKAEENLKRVLTIDPLNEAANLNLGLLMAEQGRTNEAETALRKALEANPEQATAAYNLSVIKSQTNLQETVAFASIAAGARPEEPKYSYTLAFYQLQNNEHEAAEKTLLKLLDDHPNYINAIQLLAELYMNDGRKNQAEDLILNTLKQKDINNTDRGTLQQSLYNLRSVN